MGAGDLRIIRVFRDESMELMVSLGRLYLVVRGYVVGLVWPRETCRRGAVFNNPRYFGFRGNIV